MCVCVCVCVNVCVSVAWCCESVASGVERRRRERSGEGWRGMRGEEWRRVERNEEQRGGGSGEEGRRVDSERVEWRAEAWSGGKKT